MQTLAAVLGIFGALDVPIVYMSNRWWRTQHPAPVIMGDANAGLEPTMKATFFFSVLAMHILMVFLIVERNRLEKLRLEVDVIRHELEVA
jgi:heme exporter protein C